MVERLAAWYATHRSDLGLKGIQANLERSPEDGRDKASAWLLLSRGDVEGQITVWSSGECELWGPVRNEHIPGTDPLAEHRQLQTDADLADALARLVGLFR